MSACHSALENLCRMAVSLPCMPPLASCGSAAPTWTTGYCLKIQRVSPGIGILFLRRLPVVIVIVLWAKRVINHNERHSRGSLFWWRWSDQEINTKAVEQQAVTLWNYYLGEGCYFFQPCLFVGWLVRLLDIRLTRKLQKTFLQNSVGGGRIGRKPWKFCCYSKRQIQVFVEA